MAGRDGSKYGQMIHRAKRIENPHVNALLANIAVGPSRRLNEGHSD
jgi:hypothetical protein